MTAINIRDRKKIQTRETILQSAKRLFTEQGFDPTTMEQIAEAAVVATGTLYNYFESKGDILVAIMAEHADHSLSEVLGLLVANPEDPVETLGSMISSYTAVFLSLESRLLGKAIALALENPQTMGQRLFSIDYKMITQVQEALRRMQDQGRLKPALPVIDVAYLLYSMGFMTILLSYAGVLPATSTTEYINRQVTLIIEPWLNQD